MFSFDNTYARLPDRFFARQTPATVSTPKIVKINRELAELLGLDANALATPEGAAWLSGNSVPDGAEPIALAYAGHQFGNFVPQLGDGRAILLGEIVGNDGKRRDIQLKGSGRTPFSRGGDGRAALGPVLREYVVSEAMHALGIPTTRALAAVTTGDPVHRDERLPGAVFTRVAASHVRVGTFEFFAARDDRDALEKLTAHCLARHYPDAAGAPNPALALLEKVIDAHARLVAMWLGVGFVHGVMNTDNTTISGETIDYGPCAFLDEYDPARKFSSIDRGGRYAFMRQPAIAQWNLARLAEALLPFFDDDEEAAVKVATERLQGFVPLFEAAHLRVLRGKLGLTTEADADRALAEDLFRRMADNHVDFTLFFRRLCSSAEDAARDVEAAALFETPGAFHDWAESWRRRTAAEDVPPAVRAAQMRGVNPALVPRNHRMEEAITAATLRGDFAPFETLVAALARPFEDQPKFAHLAEAPGPEQHGYRTFCGT